MKKLVGLLSLVILFSLSFAAADITLTEPGEVYNLGDKLFIEASGLIGSDSGNLNINLVCDDSTINLVKIPARTFSTEEEQSYSVPYKILNEEDLEVDEVTSLVGECSLSASMGGESFSSEEFRISNVVEVSASFDKDSYDPGEDISLTITATKENGESLEGLVEIMGESSHSGSIGGSTTYTFSMPTDTEAGEYTLDIFVHDGGESIEVVEEEENETEDDEENVVEVEALNFGETSTTFSINQIAASATISLSREEVLPEEGLEVGVQIFDQSRAEMSGTARVRVISPFGDEQALDIDSGAFDSFSFEPSATAGIWDVVLEFEGVSDTREFEILESAQASFSFEGPVLVITNVGNAFYNKSVLVQIGGEDQKIASVQLGIGASDRYNLEAPEGEYSVVVSDGKSTTETQVYLTGRAISVEDFKTGRVFSDYLFVWIFIVIVLAGAGYVLYSRSQRTTSLGSTSSSSSSSARVIEKIKAMRLKLFRSRSSAAGSLINVRTKEPAEVKDIVDLTHQEAGSAESTLALKGEKHQSAITAVAVFNFDSLTENSKNSLVSIVKEASGTKGLIDWKADHIFIVFSPLVTKTFANELLAARAGSAILTGIKEHNKKFKDSIECNVGVHAGELVASKVDGKLKYTSIRNTISFSKKLSDSNKAKLLVSDPIRKKLLRDLSVVKSKKIGEHQTFEVGEIKDRSANEAKLKDLLKRMD